MKVLIVPEDPTHDQYILKPIVERIFKDLARTARVEVLFDPHLRGVDQTLSREMVREIINDNAMINLFLIVVDRDCNRCRNEERARDREREHPDRLIACLAFEEVEVWMLALHPKRIRVPWKSIREDCDPKERYCDPMLDELGRDGPGGGRKKAMRSLTGSNWRGLLKRCPEIALLKRRIAAWPGE